jgi:hypothetical protein
LLSEPELATNMEPTSDAGHDGPSTSTLLLRIGAMLFLACLMLSLVAFVQMRAMPCYFTRWRNSWLSRAKRRARDGMNKKEPEVGMTEIKTRMFNKQGSIVGGLSATTASGDGEDDLGEDRLALLGWLNDDEDETGDIEHGAKVWR